MIGVYQIRCLPNARIYIGSSADISARWRNHRHLLNNRKHGNAKLQASWNKYGVSAFVFEVLEECSPGELVTVEQRLIDEQQPWFNIALDVSTPPMPLGSKAPPGFGAKISVALMGNQYCLGRILSQEHRDKISAGLRGHLMSDVTKARISAALRKPAKELAWRHSQEAKDKMKAAWVRRKQRSGVS